MSDLDGFELDQILLTHASEEVVRCWLGATVFASHQLPLLLELNDQVSRAVLVRPELVQQLDLFIAEFDRLKGHLTSAKGLLTRTAQVQVKR
jgi:hypothetical protein